MISGECLLGDDRRQAAQHMRFGIDYDFLQMSGTVYLLLL
jgi:hypothetical protein